MNQRRRWPAELRAAIDAADAEGIPANRILKLAKSGELDGITQGYAIPESTFFDILTKQRAARIASTEPIQPGDEEKEAGIILRRALEIAKREVAKLDAQLNDPRKTASERRDIGRQLDTFSKMVRSYEHKAASPTQRGKTQQQRGGEAQTHRRSNPLQDLISAKERDLATSQASTKVDNADESKNGRDAGDKSPPNDNANGQRDRLSSTRVPAGSSH